MELIGPTMPNLITTSLSCSSTVPCLPARHSSFSPLLFLPTVLLRTPNNFSWTSHRHCPQHQQYKSSSHFTLVRFHLGLEHGKRFPGCRENSRASNGKNSRATNAPPVVQVGQLLHVTLTGICGPVFNIIAHTAGFTYPKRCDL